MRVSVVLESFDGRAAEIARAALAFAAVMLLGAVLMLNRLGAADVCNSNEAVEGLVVQQMVERGEILFPVLNASAPMYKPPLFHWTATVLAHLFGAHDVTELTLRLPSSVLYGLGGVLLTMVFVRGWLGVPSAVLVGLVLLGSYQYVGEARFGRVDMALTFCEALALFGFLWWLASSGDGHQRPGNSRRRATAAHYLFAIALGLGVLAKGPVGMMLPLLAVGTFLVVEKRWDDLRALCAPGPALVSLAVGSSWYVAGYWGQHFDVLHRQIVSENFSRFLGGIRTMPPWYYLKPLVLNSVPFSLLVPIAVVQALRSGAVSQRGLVRGSTRDSSPARLLAIFWLVTVLFFSIAAYKRRAYLLPLWPAAAILLVWWLRVRPGARARRLGQGAVAAACGVSMVFNLLYIPRAERVACRGAQYRRAVSDIKRIVPLGTPLFFHGLGADPAPLLFYLDRTVPTLSGALTDAPRGYVLVPEDAWISNRYGATLNPVLVVTLSRRRLVLLESAPRTASAPG